MRLQAKVLKFLKSKDKIPLLLGRIHEIRVKLFKKIRLSSDPFISGDTFRALSDVKLDQISEQSLLKAAKNIERLFRRTNNHVILFIDLHCTLEINGQKRIINWLNNLDIQRNRKLSIIFHNHDVVPSKDFFNEIQSPSIQCFSPNVVDNDFGVVPIPLGIENRYFQKNGIIRHFPEKRELCSNELSQRTKSLFASFNVATNRLERQEAADSAQKFGHALNQLRIQPRVFRKSLAESLFVLSPPGNGIDCHRTWEAIYFGAIPVIKRGKLAESIYRDLPVCVVDEWSEICSMTRSQLEEIYKVLIKKSDKKAYFEYWKNVING